MWLHHHQRPRRSSAEGPQNELDHMASTGCSRTLDVPGSSPEGIQRPPTIPGILPEAQGQAGELSFLRKEMNCLPALRTWDTGLAFLSCRSLYNPQVTLNSLESTGEKSPKRAMSHTHTHTQSAVAMKQRMHCLGPKITSGLSPASHPGSGAG